MNSKDYSQDNEEDRSLLEMEQDEPEVMTPSAAFVNALRITRNRKVKAVYEYIEAKNDAREALAEMEEYKSDLVMDNKINGQNETMRRAQLVAQSKDQQANVDRRFAAERWASAELERRKDDLFTIGVLMQGLSSEKIEFRDALPLIQTIIDSRGGELE